MKKLDPIVSAQLPVIRQIIVDETWLEAERRGCSVNPNDRVVRENVCLVILRIGARLREAAERFLGDVHCSRDRFQDASNAAVTVLDYRKRDDG